MPSLRRHHIYEELNPYRKGGWLQLVHLQKILSWNLCKTYDWLLLVHLLSSL